MRDASAYQDPLVTRYADRRKQTIFSPAFKFRTWRRCWLALAEAQHERGLERVTEEHTRELRRALDEPIDYAFAGDEEARQRHDVIAHIAEYARHCPSAGGSFTSGQHHNLSGAIQISSSSGRR